MAESVVKSYFPSQAVSDLEKMTNEYGLKVARAIEQEWFSSDRGSRAGRHINTKNDSNTPFFLMLSWGPPHAPYQTAPEPYQDMYKPEEVLLRPNVPESLTDPAWPAQRARLLRQLPADIPGACADMVYKHYKPDDTQLSKNVVDPRDWWKYLKAPVTVVTVESESESDDQMLT